MGHPVRLHACRAAAGGRGIKCGSYLLYLGPTWITSEQLFPRMKKLLSPYNCLDPGKNNKGSFGDPIFIARAGSFIKWPVGGRV